MKLTQVHEIQIYLFYSLRSIKKTLEPWNNDPYLSSSKVLNSSQYLRKRNIHLKSISCCQGATSLTGQAWQLLFLTLTGHTAKILSYLPLHRHPFVLHSPTRAQGITIGDLEVQPRKRRSLCRIWVPWPTSQAGPSISPSKSRSKGTLWLVTHRSTFLGHRFKIPLVEHLLLHPRTCS